MTSRIEYREVADSDDAARVALALVQERAAAAIAARGRFVLGLCGGRTPERLYQLLAATGGDWQHWHLVYGDERCLPEGHAERNLTLVKRCWLEPAGFPAANHHVPDMSAGADRAAEAYGAAIEPLLPLDLALLGVGEDGHTASLFPGHSHPAQSVVPVHDAPKPPPDRISLSYATLCAADTVCFLATGDSKQEALRRWLRSDDLPVVNILGRRQTILVTDIPAQFARDS